VHGNFFPYKKTSFILPLFSKLHWLFFFLNYIFQQRNLHMYVPFKGQKFKFVKNNHN
jgi:hypothetical protein